MVFVKLSSHGNIVIYRTHSTFTFSLYTKTSSEGLLSTYLYMGTKDMCHWFHCYLSRRWLIVNINYDLKFSLLSPITSVVQCCRDENSVFTVPVGICQSKSTNFSVVVWRFCTFYKKKPGKIELLCLARI